MTVHYVTPEVLRNAATGLDLSSFPYPDATAAQQEAELLTICKRATDGVIGICGQELRATLDTDMESGPDWRLTLTSQGLAELRLQRFPILQVLSVAVSSALAFPPQWQLVPAGKWRLKHAMPGLYGSVAPDAAAIGPTSLIIAPGYVPTAAGRNGCLVQVTYLNGWPHCGVTDDAYAYTAQLTVDDCTGWMGVRGTLYDGQYTEDVVVSAISHLTGPGVLTLAAPLQYDHTVPVTPSSPLLFSALPATVQTATIYLAMEQMLARGAAAVSIPALPGSESRGGRAMGDLATEAEILLEPFLRTVW